MELFIQMGHNMQALALEHLEEFDGGTIIISPMNILPNKVKGYATRVHKKKGKVLVDPQLYYPRQYQKKLSQYAYWPKSDITSLEMGQFDTVVEELSKLNNEVEAEAFLLPSITAKKIDDLWNKIQKIIIESAKKYAPDMKYIHTISLSSDVLNDESQIERVIEYVEEWDVEGVYIVCEHPERYYLVDRPLWVSNIMSLVAGIKRQRKMTIVG